MPTTPSQRQSEDQGEAESPAGAGDGGVAPTPDGAGVSRFVASTPTADRARSEPAVGGQPVLDPTPAEGAFRVGVLSSPGYYNLRGGLPRIREFLSTLPEVPHREVHHPSDVARALEEFRKLAIDVVTVNGGDGTLSMVLTSLLNQVRQEEQPLLAVPAGGRTNMSAGDVGLRGDPVRQLERILVWARRGRREGLARRRIMGVHLTPGNEVLHGFFLGAGAVYQISRSCWDFRDRSRIPGMRTGLGTAVHVISRIARLIFGGHPFDPTRIRVRVDGSFLDVEEHAVLFLTTLDRMVLGLKPFWGDQPGPIHLTAIAHDHRRLLLAAATGLRGKPSRFLKPSSGYLSLNAEQVELFMDDGMTLDGEVLNPMSSAPVVVRADRFVDFVQP